MTINEAQDEVIEQFQDFTDWMDKYQLLIDLGGELEPLDAKYKTEQNLIDGCQSRVWVQCDMTDDGRLVFTADSDALIVKGIIALLIQVISGHTPREILVADLEAFLHDAHEHIITATANDKNTENTVLFILIRSSKFVIQNRQSRQFVTPNSSLPRKPTHTYVSALP